MRVCKRKKSCLQHLSSHFTLQNRLSLESPRHFPFLTLLPRLPLTPENTLDLQKHADYKTKTGHTNILREYSNILYYQNVVTLCRRKAKVRTLSQQKHKKKDSLYLHIEALLLTSAGVNSISSSAQEVRVPICQALDRFFLDSPKNRTRRADAQRKLNGITHCTTPSPNVYCSRGEQGGGVRIDPAKSQPRHVVVCGGVSSVFRDSLNGTPRL